MRQLLLQKFLSTALRTRYKIKAKGLETIRGKKGLLFLANHVSLLDPILLVTFFWKEFRLRPVPNQDLFRVKLLKAVLSLIRSIPAPNFYAHYNDQKLQELESMFEAIVHGLNAGDNVLLYPAGKLTLSAEEKLGGTSGLYSIVQQQEEVEYAFVHLKGLWGSLFSTAPHGCSPELFEQMLWAAKKIVQNGFFFVPKKTVEIEVAYKPFPLKREWSKEELNGRVEAWFLAKGPHPFVTKPYHWAKKKPVVPVECIPPVPETVSPLEKELIGKIAELTDKEVKRDSRLLYDLGLDSLEFSKMYLFLQENYGLTDLFYAEFDTPAHLAALIEERWVPPRKRDLIEKQKKQLTSFFKGRLLVYDEVYGALSLQKIHHWIGRCYRLFQQEPSRSVSFYLGGGIEAFVLVVAAKEAGKIISFGLPEALNTMPVYTTYHTVQHMQGLALKGVEKMVIDFSTLRKARAPKRWKPTHLQEAKKKVHASIYGINQLYDKDPWQFIALVYQSIQSRKKVLLPDALLKNTTWANRVLQQFPGGSLWYEV